MGVKGLWSLLKDYSQIYQDIRFRNSKLVVDGSNLAYDLYNKADLDQNHGGEYLAFQAEVQAFFKTLADCDIKAYVVIDGGLGTSDIRLNTRMVRQIACLNRIPNALKGINQGIYPPSIMSVFEQTLNNMKVLLVKCFGEADGRLAALAKELQCPVLSGDTDFYIYDLPEGVLPLEHFQWDSVENSPASSGIPCKRYTSSKFCEVFKIDRQLLPVFASLVAVKWARYVPAGGPKVTSATRVEDLLSWLGARTDRTTEDTLTAAIAHNRSQQDQTEARTMVQKFMLEYELPSSSLGRFFSEGTVPPLPAEMPIWVPEWVCASLARGDLGADILMHSRKILRIQVEHSDLPSSNLASQPIRKVLYGLLLGQRGGEVEEVDRVGLELNRVKVKPLVQEDVKLDSLPQEDRAVTLKVFLETLCVKKEMLEGVLAHLRLPVAVTCYWLRRASPERTLLKALLMVMVQGELKRRTGATGWQGDTSHDPQPLDGVVAHSFNQWQACLKDASQLNLLLCKPLPEPHFAWLYQGRLVHQRQKELQKRKPEEIVKEDQFISLYESLLGAVDGAEGLDQGSDGPWEKVKGKRRKQ